MYNRFVRNIHLRRLNHHYLCTSRGQFVPPVEQVRKVLKSLDSDIRPVPDGKYEVKVCKLCSKGNKDAPDNLWKLLINRDGSYHCYRCAEHGTFKGLKDRLMIPSEPKILSSSKLSDDKLYGNSNTNNKLDEDPSLSIVTLAGAAKASASYQPMDQKLAHSFTKNLFADMDNNDAPITDTVDCSSSPIGNETQHQISIAERARMVRHYLQHERKLSLAICERYGVGVSVQKFPNSVSGQWDDNTCVTFPWIDFVQGSSANGSSSPCIQRIKYRSLDTKGKQRILPKGGPWGFFGWHLVSEEQNTAITVTATASFASSDSDSDSTSSNSEDEITDNAIIITEGEYDALAVAQAISDYHPSDISQMWIKRAPVVSLPNGCNSLPVELIIKLEKFNKIYLWLDNDASGIAASQNFTKKLGIHRCYVVKPLENCTIQPKDANDILRYTPIDEEEDDDEVKLKPKQKSKVDSASGSMVNTGGVSREQYMRNVELMMEMVQQAQPVRHERVISFSDIKHDVLRSLIRGTLTQYDGTLCTSLPTLNEITKGFRRGELIVFSGPTGSGKTTLLSQMSIDFAAQGIPTLWGSFEITNVRLAEKMLHQYNESLLRGEPQDQILSASELSKPRKKRRQRALTAENAKLVADDFEQLPFKFMNFHGGSSLGDVLDAMDYAVYKNDIQHIILDNLQFMMPGGSSVESAISARGNSGALNDKSAFNKRHNTAYSDVSRYTAGLDGTSSRFSNITKFETQDIAIQAFRKFATINNVNVILVIHPRKEDDNLPLGISSIFGTAKATQEADMVMILQRLSQEAPEQQPPFQSGRSQRTAVQQIGPFQVKSGSSESSTTSVAPVQRNIYIDIKKNRYDGTLGKVKLNYSPHSMSFNEIKDE